MQRFFIPLAFATKNACHLLFPCPSPRMPNSWMAMFMHLHLLVLRSILDSMWRRQPLSVLPCRKVLMCSTRLMNFLPGSGKLSGDRSMPTVDQLNVGADAGLASIPTSFLVSVYRARGQLQRKVFFNQMWLLTARRLFAN